MKKQLIFNKKEISVFQVVYPDARGEEFEVCNGADFFSTSEKPTLKYTPLKKQLMDYIREKEEAIAADNREGDSEIDFKLFSVISRP